MFDIVIIGAGPAGLSASVYAKRAGLDAVTYEQFPLSGGQVQKTYDVDNYLGLPGISGPELCEKFRDHANKLGCKIEENTVSSVSKCEEGFKVVTENGEVITKTVIFAMGADHAALGVPGEEDLAGMGVSYCATCDGAFFKGRSVAVVGGGDVAVEDALFLARGCSKVYLIHRRDSLRAAGILRDKLLATENIEVLWDTVVTKINGEDSVESLDIENVKTKEKSVLSVNGIFVAVGINPVNDLIKKMASDSGETLVEINEKGYVVSDEMGATKTPGLFVAGDLRAKKLRQIVTAVADGANAVTAAEAYINEMK